MKVQLVTAKHAEAGRTTNSPRPPIGLEILAAALEQNARRQGRGIDIEILDGEILPPEALTSRLGADWVGFSDTFSNHRESLALARTAKQRGAQVVLGGPNATHMAERILRNHPFVDFVVAGDGEAALPGLLLGADPRHIPNLRFRDGGSIQQNPIRNVDVDSLPPFTLGHIRGFAAYLAGNDPVPISLVRGCAHATKEGRCAYCSIPHGGLRLLHPNLAWRQIRLLRELYGVSSFFETGDTFLVEAAAGEGAHLYAQRLLAQRPSDTHVTLRIYERPEAITEETALLLKKLGVKEVFLGIEHVDEDVRGRSRGTPLKRDIHGILDVLRRMEIQLVVSAMFGLPGETEDSALRNRDFLLDAAARYPNIRSFFVSIATPIFGSRLFRTVASDPTVRREYNNRGHDLERDDLLDYGLLTRLVTERFTAVEPRFLHGILESLGQQLGPHRMTGFGATSESC